MANLNPPTCKLKIGGITFEGKELKGKIHIIEVEQVVDGPWSCKITLDDGKDEFSTGQYKIKEGDSISISLGYQREPVLWVFDGEVSGLEADRKPEQRKLLTVRGFDPLMRLSKGRTRTSWLNIKDNDIFSEVAGKHGLKVGSLGKADHKHDYVMQNNVTDLQFVYERARRLGYLVNAKGNEIHFREPDLTVCCELTWDASNLSAGSSKRLLKDFKAESATPGQLEEASVRGWDPKKKEKIYASTGEVHGQTMGGQYTGGQHTGAKNQYSEQPVKDIAEAERMAKSMLNSRAQSYMTGNGECEGDGRIQAGKVIKIDAIGVEMDGDYYVTKCTHKLQAGAGSGLGYQCNFEVMRSGR